MVIKTTDVIFPVTKFYGLNGLAAEKRGLRTYANSKDPDQPALPQSVQILRCSPAQYGDFVEDRGQIAKILTRPVVTQIDLGFRCSYLPYGSFLSSGGPNATTSR